MGEFLEIESSRPTTARTWLPIVVLAVSGCAALIIDVRLARWLLDGGCPSLVGTLCRLSEVFAHGLGVCLIAVAMLILDPARRSMIPRVLAAALGAGLTTDLIKLTIVRTRPRDFSFVGSVFDTFGDWLPGFSAGSTGQSFPSSHAATAAGLAIVLAWVYPHGRRLFVGLLILACAQRVTSGAHFLSDVLFGVAMGCIVARQCVGDHAAARFFDRLEDRLQAPSTEKAIAYSMRHRELADEQKSA